MSSACWRLRMSIIPSLWVTDFAEMEFSINKTTNRIRESFSGMHAERQFITESEVRRFYDESSFTPKKVSTQGSRPLGTGSDACTRCCSKCGSSCLSFPCGCTLFVVGLALASCYLWVPDENISKITKRVVSLACFTPLYSYSANMKWLTNTFNANPLHIQIYDDIGWR